MIKVRSKSPTLVAYGIVYDLSGPGILIHWKLENHGEFIAELQEHCPKAFE